MQSGQVGKPAQQVSEAQSHGDLSSAAATEFGASSAGDASEGRAGDVHLRVGEVGVIGDVGERCAGFQLHSFGYSKRLGQAQRKIDGARTSEYADAGSSEPSDGRSVARRVDADAALPSYARIQPRTDESILVEPLKPGSI